MKYLINTNQGDFIFTKKQSAKSWLSYLHSQTPKITSLWVYDETGEWIDNAEIIEGKATKCNIYPDGELRKWVIWACKNFDHNSYCKSFEIAYYNVLRITELVPQQVFVYEEFLNKVKGKAFNF